MSGALKQLRTEIWCLAVPPDWAVSEKGSALHPCIEAADRSKGVYVHCHPLHHVSPADAVLRRCKRDIEVMKDMNRVLHLKDHWCVEDDDSASRGMDYFDPESRLRIVTHVIASADWIVGGSFQDYECESYEASKIYFEPLIRSLRFSDKPAEPGARVTAPPWQMIRSDQLRSTMSSHSQVSRPLGDVAHL